MGKGAVSVTTLTDRIYQLIKIETDPSCAADLHFYLERSVSRQLAGRATPAARRAARSEMLCGAAAGAVASAMGGAVSAVASAVAGIAGAASGNQRRNGFKCIVESVKQKFTLFSPEGIPLRATLTVALREYKTLDEQLAHLNLTSPDRTHSHVTQNGDTLSRIAAQYYRRRRRLALDCRRQRHRGSAPSRCRAHFLTIPPTQ